jgi:hemoglobin-like flavoprotein
MGPASSQSIFHENINLQMCVKIVMPLYYTTDPVTTEDLARAKKSWNLIVDDESRAFKTAKLDPNFTEISCLSYFYTVFYNRLFDIHPCCKPLFKGSIQIQGKALAKIISFLLKDHSDTVLLTEVLTALDHRKIYDYGVKAHEYGYLGESLIYALAVCVGKDDFDEATALAWARIYSMVIAVVVPLHVQYELAQQRSWGGRPPSEVETSSELSDLSPDAIAKRTSIATSVK